MKKLTTKAVVLSALMMSSMASQAGIVIGGTRVIFPGDKKEASLSINNPDSSPYLIQSWIETEKGSMAKDAFIMTPLLFRLDHGEKNLLRIEDVGSEAQDHETLYWINIKSISASKKQDNVLKIAVKNRLKLIYRPVSLQTKTPEDFAEKLHWSRAGNTLTVDNPTPYYMNFMYLHLNGKSVPAMNFAPPHGSVHFTLPANVSGNNLTWALVSDYGSVGKEHQSAL